MKWSIYFAICKFIFFFRSLYLRHFIQIKFIQSRWMNQSVIFWCFYSFILLHFKQIAPWKIKQEHFINEKDSVFYLLLKKIWFVTHFILPLNVIAKIDSFSKCLPPLVYSHLHFYLVNFFSTLTAHVISSFPWVNFVFLNTVYKAL